MLMLSFITTIANKLLRIATQLIDSQEPQEIDFNHFGLHYGDKQIKFANECGVLTRSMISINYQTWKKVPQGDLRCCDKQRCWNIQNNKRRGDVLKICNTAWKSYKKRLIRDFMANGRDPIPIYPYLDPDTWKTFKKERSSKEFQIISEKARANAKLQKNPAWLGPHGYRGRQAQWEQEIASGGLSEELASELCKIKSQRSKDFVMGRLSKNESGSYYAPLGMQATLTKLAEVESQISRGDWVPEPGEDSLTAVLGREHPGRTRAVGHTVGLRKAMHGIDKKKRKMHAKESMDELRAKLDDVTKQVAELKAVIHDSGKQVTDNVSLRVHNSSSDSMPTLAAITNPTQCKLVLPYGALDQDCATDLVFPYGDGLIHSLPLRENHMKVLIDQINKDFQSLPIPVVTDEVSNLQNAVGQIIQWPRNAIILTQIQGRKQQNSTPSLPQTSVGGCIRKNTLTPMNKSKPIELLRERLKNNPLIHVVADDGILETDKFEFWVAHDEILQLLNKRTLDVTILTVWEMNLHSIARVKNKCSFLNPHKILGESCQENPEAVINYIVDVMRIQQGKQFLIAPYLQRYFMLIYIIIVKLSLYLLFILILQTLQVSIGSCS
uniref:DUF8039 domain-containing protein n=1 Tax=Lactuca sativa TaxID=4236 RepID=A0A9R1WAM4_LACSA|nr:hypothetical protein LSAT_V11C300151710 [Lactuca sativa]